MEHNQLSSVHDALKEAQLNVGCPEYQGAMSTHTFRTHDELKESARKICERHGVGLDEYLRQCMRSLVKDYVNK